MTNGCNYCNYNHLSCVCVFEYCLQLLQGWLLKKFGNALGSGLEIEEKFSTEMLCTVVRKNRDLDYKRVYRA